MVPSGKHTKSYDKWPFIVDIPIKNTGSFHSYVSLPKDMGQDSEFRLSFSINMYSASNFCGVSNC